MTIDVEDWFHILDVNTAPDFAEWNSFPSHIEKNLHDLLDLLGESGARATLFVLGWVAQRFPGVLREAAGMGHELASHGFSHEIVTGLSRSAFGEDIRAAKDAIENATGVRVSGYRAPGFSITAQTPWAFEEIVEAGYTFDSSVFPASHGHGGMPGSPRHPWILRTSSGSLVEMPISVADTPFGPQCFFGGGYLRLFPMWIVHVMANQLRNQGRGVIWYIHPREIDPDHPRLEMSAKRRFRSYFNLHSTRPKLRSVLASGNFATMGEIAARISSPLVLDGARNIVGGEQPLV